MGREGTGGFSELILGMASVWGGQRHEVRRSWVSWVWCLLAESGQDTVAWMSQASVVDKGLAGGPAILRDGGGGEELVCGTCGV